MGLPVLHEQAVAVGDIDHRDLSLSMHAFELLRRLGALVGSEPGLAVDVVADQNDLGAVGHRVSWVRDGPHGRLPRLAVRSGAREETAAHAVLARRRGVATFPTPLA